MTLLCPIPSGCCRTQFLPILSKRAIDNQLVIESDSAILEVLQQPPPARHCCASYMAQNPSLRKESILPPDTNSRCDILSSVLSSFRSYHLSHFATSPPHRLSLHSNSTSTNLSTHLAHTKPIFYQNPWQIGNISLSLHNGKPVRRRSRFHPDL